MCPFISVFGGAVLCRPVFRVGIIRGKPCKNSLVVCNLVVHILCGSLGFVHPFIGYITLL